MFINRISFSKSDVIDQCLGKYDLKYNQKLPGFGSSSEPSLNFGKFIHKLFEDNYRSPTLTLLLTEAAKLKGTYKVESEFNEKTKICLENFIFWNQALGETLDTEMEHRVFLDQTADIEFTAIIDRVIKGTDGGYLVIDYKTGKREKKKNELLNDKQMMGYAYVIHEKYKVPYHKIVCAHFYPVSGNFVTVKFSQFQIDKWKKKEIDKVWRLRKKTKDEFPFMKNMFCGNCEFKPLCEHFSTKEERVTRLAEQIVLRDKLKAERKLNEEQKSADKK